MEQLEIAQLKREVIRLKAERDIVKKSRGLRREGIGVKFGFVAKPADWLCGALHTRNQAKIYVSEHIE
jgi:putative transposase